MDRFKNWVRWANQRGLHRGQAGSIEGDYRSGQIWESEEPRGEPVDVVDAQLVNRAYSQLGERVRRTIQYCYFRPYWRPRYLAQKLEINVKDLEHETMQAVRTLILRVEFIEKRGYPSPTVTHRLESLSGTG